MKTALLLATLLLTTPLEEPPVLNDGFTLSIEDRLKIVALVNAYADRVSELERDVARLRGKTGCI